jgi:hypothetical protein
MRLPTPFDTMPRGLHALLNEVSSDTANKVVAQFDVACALLVQSQCPGGPWRRVWA